MKNHIELKKDEFFIDLKTSSFFNKIGHINDNNRLQTKDNRKKTTNNRMRFLYYRNFALSNSENDI